MWWWKIPAMPSRWKISSPLVKMYINININIYILYIYAPAKTNALIPKMDQNGNIWKEIHLKRNHQVYKPSRKRTYPTCHGKFGKSSTRKCLLGRDMLVPRRVHENIMKNWSWCTPAVPFPIHQINPRSFTRRLYRMKTNKITTVKSRES